MTPKPLIFALVAGEVSGDILGEGLIQSLKARYPNARFIGIGGERMQAQGLESLYPMEELAVMGLVEVLGRLPRLLQIMHRLTQQLKDIHPDCFIGIDAPDFNLRVEKKLKKAGIRTVHYVSPSIWAWRPKRIFAIAKATHMVLSLLPFEKKFYDRYQVPCTFVGHTLADDIAIEPQSMTEHRSRLGLELDASYLAVLPGSRRSEIIKLSQPFFQALQVLQTKKPHMKLIVPCVSLEKKQLIIEQQKAYAPELDITYVLGQSRQVMAAANQVLLASGTAALEAMLLKKPMVVAYKVNPISYWLAQRLLTVEHVSLPNLLSQTGIYVPELIQDVCEPNHIADVLLEQDSQNKTHMMSEFYRIHSELKQNASEVSAQAITDLLERNYATS